MSWVQLHAAFPQAGKLPFVKRRSKVVLEVAPVASTNDEPKQLGVPARQVPPLGS